MKTLIILLLSLFVLVSCYQKVNHAEIEKALQFCADKGGVDTIREDIVCQTRITCLNGESEWDINIVIKKYGEGIL